MLNMPNIIYWLRQHLMRIKNSPRIWIYFLLTSLLFYVIFILERRLDAFFREKAKVAAVEKFVTYNKEWRSKFRDTRNFSQDIQDEVLNAYRYAKYAVVHKSSNIGLLIRACRPSDGQLSRIKNLALELEVYNIQVFMSFDVTNGHKYFYKASTYLEDTNIVFHKYETRDILRAFGDTLEIILNERMPPFYDRITSKYSLSVAWGFHIEAINLWWSQIKALNYFIDYIWVFEEDVVITGSAVSFFKFYTDNSTYRTCDLITYGLLSAKPYYSEYSQDPTGWEFTDCVSDLYAALVPVNHQQLTREHVQRFSARYLTVLNELSSRGFIGWSEQSSISIANSLPDYQVCALLDEHINEEYFSSAVKLTWEKFKVLSAAQNHTSQRQPKLWHAVKD